MHKASDLAALPLTTEREHKSRASTLLRLAAGVRTQSRADLGLSSSEQALLGAAASLLEDLATASKGAAKIARRREDLLERRMAEAVPLMADTFGSIKTMADKVALVGAVSASVLRPGGIPLDLAAIEDAYQDALNTIRYTAAKSDQPLAGHLAKMWSIFQARRAEHIENHRVLIESIESLVAMK